MAGFDAWVIIFGCLYLIGATSSLYTGCDSPRAKKGGTLMTVLVFSWNFMNAFDLFYQASYNTRGVERADRLTWFTYVYFGLLIWYLSLG